MDLELCDKDAIQIAAYNVVRWTSFYYIKVRIIEFAMDAIVYTRNE